MKTFFWSSLNLGTKIGPISSEALLSRKGNCTKKQFKNLEHGHWSTSLRCERRVESLKRIVPLSLSRRVVNGPTSSGPNPKINLKPKSCPKKCESKVRSEKFSNIANLFLLFFCTSKTKSTSQARIKPDIFVNFRPEPDPKSPARLITLLSRDMRMKTIDQTQNSTKIY